MAVASGNKGKVTLYTSAGQNAEVAEMGAWTISGPTLSMIDYGAFGDERGRQKPGMVEAQTISFNGYCDFTTGSNDAQAKLVTYLSSGTPIYSSSTPGTTAGPSRLRLWANDDLTLPGYGYWSQSSSTAPTILTVKSYVTSLEVGQDMGGVQTIAFTLAVTGGALEFSTAIA